MHSLFNNYKIIILLISQFLFGQDPPNINWKQINTKHYDIIFPYEIQNEALRYAKQNFTILETVKNYEKLFSLANENFVRN